MQRITFLVLIFLVMLVSCQNRGGGSSNSGSGNYDQSKSNMENQESSSPTSFLNVSGTYRKNLTGQTVIEGTVSNSGSVSTFKDVEVRVDFISGTNSVISSENYVIYEFVAPGRSTNFKIKVRGPREAESVNMNVVNAKSK